jgi:thioredoxin 1
MSIKITNENFENEVINSNKPVLIEFWAAWCGPCKMVSPTIEILAEELEGQVKVGKINVDEEQELAGNFGVMSIPTMVMMKDGKITHKAVGAMSKDAIKAQFSL